MEERMTVIMRCRNVDQAQYYFEALENAGYDPVIEDESTEEEPETEALPDWDGPVTLLVKETVAAEASKALEEMYDSGMGGGNHPGSLG